MNRLILLVGFALSLSVFTSAQPKANRVRYGSNPAAGSYFVHDGVKLYYEVYGKGEPLLVIHGNGGSILDMSKQIEHFRKSYRVIAMDSRDHGRSADTTDKLTYEKMTDDLAALLTHLKTGPVYLIGWSDGGIEALLLGIRHPNLVKKLAADAANLNPTDKALRPEAVEFIKDFVRTYPADKASTAAGRRELKVTSMMMGEPNVPLSELKKISAPTLVLAGDHDVIDEHHTVDIFLNIPNAQLAIFPNSTHAVPYDDAALFNRTIERFFGTPYAKKDRITDMFKSIEKLRSGH